MTAIIDDIFATFRRSGDSVYLGEPVSLTEHMLQSAHAAEQDGAPAALVAAAALHDFGTWCTTSTPAARPTGSIACTRMSARGSWSATSPRR